MRALASERASRTVLKLAIASLAAVLWFLWFFLAEVVVYETSESARVEVDKAAHRVQVAASGRVVTTHLALGRRVEAGEILVELDDRAVRLELAEKTARVAGISAQMAPLQQQIAAQKRRLDEQRRIARALRHDARTKLQHANEATRLAQGELERAEQLKRAGVGSAAELARKAAEALAEKATADARRIDVERTAAELKAREVELEGDMARLVGQAALLEADRVAELAAIKRLEHKIEMLQLRTPVAGTIGEITALQPGVVLQPGDTVAAVVPDGTLRMIAFFNPAAIGRVRAGQRARIRLDSYPWAQYGTVEATVSNVASEARKGNVRVELVLASTARSAIRIEHGLIGQVEVEVEKVTPAMLVVRAAGRLLDAEHGKDR